MAIFHPNMASQKLGEHIQGINLLSGKGAFVNTACQSCLAAQLLYWVAEICLFVLCWPPNDCHNLKMPEARKFGRNFNSKPLPGLVFSRGSPKISAFGISPWRNDARRVRCLLTTPVLKHVTSIVQNVNRLRPAALGWPSEVRGRKCWTSPFGLQTNKHRFWP